MLASQLYSPTLREMPADAEVMSHKLMLRSGMIRKVGNGLYAYLPLARRVIKKIEAIIHEEMAAIGAQEVMMPILQPAEIWQKSGRWNVYGKEMFRLEDRHQRNYCLGPTHEELVTTLVHLDVSSYKQMPLTLYQIQNKYRDEVRPRFGLMRSREFVMKDAYSFDVSESGLDVQYRAMYDAYMRVFARCGLEFRPVEADSGAIGGSGSHEFMAFADAGEAAVVRCTECTYAANLEAAVPKSQGKTPMPLTGELELEKVATPNAKTIESVASYLEMPMENTIKAVVFASGETVIVAMVRGDADVNDVQVGKQFGLVDVEMADHAALERVGLVGGYISPIGISQSDQLKFVVDEAVMQMHDAVCGANEEGMHYIHVEPSRDFVDVKVAIIRLITAQDGCPRCSGKLDFARGIEVGQVFKLGTKYSEALEATYLNENGKSMPMVMGCYGIGVSRTMAAAIEQNFDKNGIVWPCSLAPYQVVVVPVNMKDETLVQAAEKLYQKLCANGVETVLDDRNERAGIKFKDADLIGYPLRITVGKTFANGGTVEMKERRSGKVTELPIVDVPQAIVTWIDEH